MAVENQFDALDLRILKILSANARIPFSSLASELNVSNSLIHQRIKKLEESGVLKQPIYQLDSQTLGYQSSCYTLIMVENVKFLKSVIESLKKIPEIVECMNIAGRYALMVKIYAYNNTHLRNVIYENIQSIEGVEGTNTTFSFETSFRRPVAVDLEA